MAAVTICSDFGAPQIKSVTVSSVSPSICHKVLGPDAMIVAFWILSFNQLFHFQQEVFQFLFAFCHKGGVICISEVTDISPGNLDSRLGFTSPAFCMMYSAYKLNKGDNIQPWCTPLPVWNQSVVPCPIRTVASWPAYRFLRKVWVHLSKFVKCTKARVNPNVNYGLRVTKVCQCMFICCNKCTH